jgi:hypothetical protein
MASVPVKFYVKFKDGNGNCNAVAQVNTITLRTSPAGADVYRFTTDATGYARQTINTGQYYAYTQLASGAPACATCQVLLSITIYNQTVTLCNTCAAAKGPVACAAEVEAECCCCCEEPPATDEDIRAQTIQMSVVFLDENGNPFNDLRTWAIGRKRSGNDPTCEQEYEADENGVFAAEVFLPLKADPKYYFRVNGDNVKAVATSDASRISVTANGKRVSVANGASAGPCTVTLTANEQD